ncbi:M protein trans-acting positive regulator PRD domain-containing protein [Granulicatella elegans]|uniref:M protein trans-acting positive regulator PRD domain-containing protein n=1 Tax=Granulicatella elegans TaxID=137732 RepID=UPI0028D2DDEB|nr:M protein trans-acting positive regulator PRD domain-containing protein [Granulicatella elegans]
MRLLLSSKEKRQLKLMEYLMSSRNWTHIKILSEKFMCTERILKQDIAELREAFPHIDIQSSTNGIKAYFTKETSLQDIYRYFFSNSQNYSLLEYMFFHEGETITEISNAFYTTPANLYRIVNKLEKDIQTKYNFNIQLSPISITGNEIDIRYFFTQYFSERYYFLEWPFSDFSEEDLDKFAKYFYEPTNYPMTFATFHMYKWMVMIGIYRVRNKHYVPIPDNFFEEIFPPFAQLPDIEEKLVYFSEKFQLSLTPEVLAQIFLSFIQDAIFLSPEEFYASLEKDEYAKNSCQLLDEMLLKLEFKLNIHFHNRNELIWYMHNTVHLERQETFTDPLLFDQKQITIRNFKTHFSTSFEIMKEEILNYLQVMNRSHTPEHIEHLIYTLFTHGEDTAIQLLLNRPQIKVVVISNFDHAHAITLMNILSYYCNNRFIFENWTDIHLSSEILNQSDYDIIVSNFYIEGLEKPFICHNNLTIMELINYLNGLSDSF